MKSETIKIQGDDLSEMRQFYQDELDKTLRRMQHIKNVLEQLGVPEKNIQIQVTQTTSPEEKTTVKTQKSPATSTGKRRGRPSKSAAQKPPKAAKAIKKAPAKGKRGPKGVWEEVIEERLKTLDKPLTYEELTDAVMAHKKLPESKRKNTKQAIVNVIFRLRKQNRIIDTFSSGGREKYIALQDWMEGEGLVKDQYVQKISA